MSKRSKSSSKSKGVVSQSTSAETRATGFLARDWRRASTLARAALSISGTTAVTSDIFSINLSRVVLTNRLSPFEEALTASMFKDISYETPFWYASRMRSAIILDSVLEVKLTKGVLYSKPMVRGTSQTTCDSGFLLALMKLRISAMVHLLVQVVGQANLTLFFGCRNSNEKLQLKNVYDLSTKPKPQRTLEQTRSEPHRLTQRLSA